MSIQELEAEVKRLSPSDLAIFSNWFKKFAVSEVEGTEHPVWADFSAQGLARAYSESEPEYTLADVKRRCSPGFPDKHEKEDSCSPQSTRRTQRIRQNLSNETQSNSDPAAGLFTMSKTSGLSVISASSVVKTCRPRESPKIIIDISFEACDKPRFNLRKGPPRQNANKPQNNPEQKDSYENQNK